MTTEVIKPNESVPQFSNEDYLRFVQARRLNFIKGVEAAVETSEGLATLDPDRQSNYLAALRDIEKQVITLDKMKQDQASDKERNKIIAEAILEAARTSAKEQAQRFAGMGGKIPDPSVIPQKKLIPGETQIGDHIENYSEYKTRTGLLSDPDPLSDFQDV